MKKKNKYQKLQIEKNGTTLHHNSNKTEKLQTTTETI